MCHTAHDHVLPTLVCDNDAPARSILRLYLSEGETVVGISYNITMPCYRLYMSGMFLLTASLAHRAALIDFMLLRQLLSSSSSSCEISHFQPLNAVDKTPFQAYRYHDNQFFSL